MPVVVCEVGPRDGLQNLPRHLTVAERIALIDRLSAAGLKRIEAVSFVNDARVPQMAGAETVLASIRRPPGTEFAALILNARGAERARECQLHELRVVVVASDTFSMRNQGLTSAEAVAGFRRIATPELRAGRRLVGVIAAAFGCPFEGEIPVGRVVDIAKALIDAGADEVILADTIGAGGPVQVEALFEALEPSRGDVGVGCHFHNTRNLGFANAFAAIRCGASVLDSAIGGLGGCPFAPRATGNIATEDLAFLLRSMDAPTPFDADELIAVNRWLGSVIGESLPGLVARAGLFPDIINSGRDSATAAPRQATS
jgi:isopropylmalate/homocitrate/citramalate synthase